MNSLGGATPVRRPRSYPAVRLVFRLGQAGFPVQPEDVAGADIHADPAAVAFFRVHLNLHFSLPITGAMEVTG